MSLSIENLENIEKEELRKYVELYRRLGFSIIPLRYRSKEPMIQWLEFQKRRATDEEVERWLGSGRINLAVVCGSISENLVVIDFDDYQHFEDFFDFEKIKNSTIIVKTARGVHVYFRTSKPVKSFKIPGLHLDVKSEGSYVVAPPSIHPAGVKYEFINNPWNLQSIPVVDDLESAIWARAAQLGVFKHGDSEDPPCIRRLMDGVEEGMRNEATIRLASYWLYFKSLPPNEVLNRLLEWNGRNRPPLDDREVKACLESLRKHGYEYGCTGMRELGVCNEAFQKLCKLSGKFEVRRKQVVYTPAGVLSDGKIFEEVFRNGKALFAVYDPGGEFINEVEEVQDGDVIYKPIMNKDVETGQVMLPSTAEEYESDEKLFNEVMNFLNKWHEQPDSFERILDAVYVFLTWIYDTLPQIPYRRAKGRWGSGKTAWLETVGSICYRPVILAGCDSEASIRRTFDLWRGTALIDEADFTDSSLYSAIIKILNIGFSKTQGWYRCCNENNARLVEAFYVFGPKLLCTRREFKDIALESRCISFISRKGSGRAPLYRGEQFKAEALRLRNKLLLWRFRNYRRIVEVSKQLEKEGLFSESFNGKVEPRIGQVILPLTLVFESPELKKSLLSLAEFKTEEVRSLDPDAWLEEEVPKAMREIAVENGGLKVLAPSEKVTQVTLVTQVSEAQQKSKRDLIPIRIKDIAERLKNGDMTEGEVKGLTRRISNYIRTSLGFVVKKGTGNYSYAYVPIDFLNPGGLLTKVTSVTKVTPNPPTDSIISNIRSIFENCKIPGEDYAEEAFFINELKKILGEEKALEVFNSLLRKVFIIKLPGGRLKWL